jgi:DNA-binding LacI/PurR family transcriptional regulator
MSHVTLQDVVLHSGYSIGTVSRALSGRGSVSAKARNTIEASARALGYRPDPALSALSSYRKKDVGKGADNSHHTEIEVVLSQHLLETWDGNPVLRGLRRQAELYGFELHASCPRKDPDELKHILHQAYHRKVRFVIFFPDLGLEFPELDIDRSRFEMIGLSNSWETYGVHVVAPNHYANTLLACEYLSGQGAKRLGVVSMRHMEANAAYKFSSAATTFNHQHLPTETHIPPLILEPDTCATAFPRWLKEQDPDMILFAGNYPLEVKTNLLKLAADRPVRLLYDAFPSYSPLMDMRLEAVGRDAVNLVKQLMLIRLHAMPGYPVHLYVPGRALFGSMAGK